MCGFFAFACRLGGPDHFLLGQGKPAFGGGSSVGNGPCVRLLTAQLRDMRGELRRNGVLACLPGGSADAFEVLDALGVFWAALGVALGVSRARGRSSLAASRKRLRLRR